MSPIRLVCRGSKNKVLLWLLMGVSCVIFIGLHDLFNAVNEAHNDDPREPRSQDLLQSGAVIRSADQGGHEIRHGTRVQEMEEEEIVGRKEEEEEMKERKVEKEEGGMAGERSSVTVPVSVGDGGGGGGESLGSSPQRGGTIVYSCNLLAVCGGWADRQKGIVSAFVLSVLMGRGFKLDMPRPCDVSIYLAPNQVDWILKPGEADSGTRSDVEGIDSHGYDLLMQMLKVEDLNLLPQLRARYVFLTWNMELVHLLRTHPLARHVPWLSPQKSIAEIYHQVLTTLFQPTPTLAARLSSLQGARPPGSRLACAQIRVGGSAVFRDSETFNTVHSAQKVIDHLREYGDDPDRYRVLFASDNVEVLKMARHAFPRTFMETPGPVTHVDKYQGQDACAGLGRAILDQLMLATCDVLIISESGLGKIAAFLRNTDEELFLFHDSKISAFRRDLPFPNRVFW